jgi:hypothetical protein
MPEKRKFTIVTPDGSQQTISYSGQPVEVKIAH